MKKALTQLDQKSLISWLQDQEEKPFHAKQIFYWLYQKNILSIEQMTNLSKPLRERLTKEFNCHSLILHSTKDSEDGQTTKYLFLLPDNNFVESVLIRAPDRVTLCVSSQVGCPARCAFCASGKKGLVRNLKFFEILEQVLFVQNHIGKKLSNIVFMGMGEPLENYENVIPAIKMLCDPSTFAFSPRRITLSTVGIIEGIEKLLQEDIKISLVLSLHAPNQEIRKRLIPYAKKHDLEKLLDLMDQYFKKTKREVTFEYTLIHNFNDREEDAFELAKLLATREKCTINLIPYNPIDGVQFTTSPNRQVARFRDILQRHGLNVTWRYTKGRDIAAACGQLALKEKEALINLQTKDRVTY